MKISTKVEFGIIALVDIALNSGKNEAVTMYSISQRHNISSKYLEQIMTILRQGNLIRGIKGSRGGYNIARPSDEITLKEIIDTLDISVLENVNFYNVNEDSVIVKTLKSEVWDNITAFLQNFQKKLLLLILQRCVNRRVVKKNLSLCIIFNLLLYS